MHNPLFMHPLQPSQQTLHKLLYFFFSKVAVFFLDAMEELTPRYQLQYHIDRILGLEHTF